MIHFNLICANDHEFEGWFQNGAAFDAQARKKQVACPVCDETGVKKAPMAPAVAHKKNVSSPTKGDTTDSAGQAAHMRQALGAFRDAVEKNCENVGDQFAEEARKIHYGETQARDIYGRTSNDEAEELRDEGVPFARLPWPKRTDS
ncbi:MAG: DUF1178 family protein [Alphaproteobacteria bacterium]|nr:DUF1178 family protein [Alphaproteobacteria bacterium]